MNNQFRLSVIIPCYNEEESLLAMYNVLAKELKCYTNKEFIFVDDGSKDKTLDILKELAETDKELNYIQFSRNFGHQYAVKAGIDSASGDCVVCIDADLQQPPSLIHSMIEKWQEGYDIVYSIRKETINTSFFKKTSSSMFYKMMNGLTEQRIEEGAADFRLMDRKVVDVICQFKENSLFLRGLISFVGFKQTSVSYIAAERFGGVSKYTFSKMLKFAIEGITSFSVKPLRMSIYMGIISALCGFAYSIYVVYESFYDHDIEKGWPTVVVLILLIGGFIMIMLGIIGEYVGKMFLEVKNRPSYIVRDSNLRKD